MTPGLVGSSTTERLSGCGGGLSGFLGALLPSLSVPAGQEHDSKSMLFGSLSQPQEFINSYNEYFWAPVLARPRGVSRNERALIRHLGVACVWGFLFIANCGTSLLQFLHLQSGRSYWPSKCCCEA